MFSKKYPPLPYTNLSVSKLKHYLKSLLKPEFKHLQITLVPPVTEQLVNSIAKGHKVQFRASVPDKLKLRLKVAVREGNLNILHFSDKSWTVSDLTAFLAAKLKVPASHLFVIFRRVKLSPGDRLENYTDNHSLKLTVVVAQSDLDFAYVAIDMPWLLYGVGLNYEAECLNSYCMAYRQVVVVHKGYGTFQLKEDQLMGEDCPICKERGVMRAYGVLSCHYTFRANSDWDNTTGKHMEYERLQTFQQIQGSPVIRVFKRHMPYS
jgi:hypothetical protein